MNAKWFAPLLLLCFAAFILAAKAYLTSIPRQVIPPPALEPAERIYGEIPVVARRDAALSRVFRPRPRSLEPLPILAMTRPIPEPIRPTPGASSPPRMSHKTDTSIAAVEVISVASAAPATGIDETFHAQETVERVSADAADAAESSGASDEVARAVDRVLRGDPAFEGAAGDPALQASTSDGSDEAENIAASESPPPPPVELLPPSGLQSALLAVVDQIDSAAVRLRSNYENGPAVVLARAFDSLAAGQYEAAVRHFDAVLARDVNLPQAWSGRGESLVGLNRFEEAAESYARAVAHVGGGTTARYNYGVVLYRLSRYADASKQFRVLVAQDPDHAEGHYNLATLAQRDGRLAEAVEEWRSFTRLRPTVAGGWFNLGIVQMDYDRPGDAVECFKKVIALDRNDADAHINLAMAHLAADQPSEALKALETAELRLPGDRVVLRYLADVHAQLADAGGPDAVIHRQQADACRARIAASPPREPRPAIAGSSIDAQP